MFSLNLPLNEFQPLSCHWCWLWCTEWLSPLSTSLPIHPSTPPSQIDKMFVIKVGELKLLKDGQATTDTAFVHEAGGFSFFGENALQVRSPCPPHSCLPPPPPLPESPQPADSPLPPCPP